MKSAPISGASARRYSVRKSCKTASRVKGEERAVPLRTDGPERTGLTRQIAAAVEVTR